MSLVQPPSPDANSRARVVVEALLRQIRNEIPDFLSQGAIVSRHLIRRATIIARRYVLAVGSGFAAAGLAALLPSLMVVLVNLVGFGPGGVVAGSLAAALQSAIWGANTGGLFAALQSFGATAVIAPPVTIGLGITGLVIGAGFLGWWLYRRNRQSTIGASVDDDEDDDDNDDDGLEDVKFDSEGKVVARSAPNQGFNFFNLFRSPGNQE